MTLFEGVGHVTSRSVRAARHELGFDLYIVPCLAGQVQAVELAGQLKSYVHS